MLRQKIRQTDRQIELIIAKLGCRFLGAMEQRFFGVQSTSTSLNTVRGLNDYGRRLLQVGNPDGKVRPMRVLVSSDATSPSPPPPPPSTSPSKTWPLDPNVVIIMVVLLFALICAAFINSLMRFILRRRAMAQHARAMFQGRAGEDNSSEHGLDSKTLNSLPILTFKTGETSKPTQVECAICLSEFTENDKLRLLPSCNHVFHLECIDMWLLSHISCPVCRDAIKESEPPSLNADQGADAGGVFLLTRDEHGNASARFSTSVGDIIGGPGGTSKREMLDVRAELLRDTSWNSLSEARFTRSRRLSRGESLSDRMDSSRRSFRSQIAAILASDRASSGRWPASSSVTAGALPSASSARNSAEGLELVAHDQLRAQSETGNPTKSTQDHEVT